MLEVARPHVLEMPPWHWYPLVVEVALAPTDGRGGTDWLLSNEVSLAPYGRGRGGTWHLLSVVAYIYSGTGYCGGTRVSTGSVGSGIGSC